MFVVKAKKIRRIVFIIFSLMAFAIILPLAIIILRPSPPPVRPQLVPTQPGKLGYGCPIGYTYISYEDAINFQSMICVRDDGPTLYRIQGGGSATCKYGQFVAVKTDPRVIHKAICIQSTVSTSSLKFVYNTESLACDAGYARASISETKQFVGNNCYNFYYNTPFGYYDILRIGVQGTLKGYIYNCAINEWDPTRVDSVLCVKREVQDIILQDEIEDMCGPGTSLYTVEEVLKDQKGPKTLCQSLPVGETVRLAGGASMQGPSVGCRINEDDRSQLNYSLCGLFPRPTN